MGVLKSSRRGIQAERRRHDLGAVISSDPYAGTYAGKVLGYGPIAYWPLWEAVAGPAEAAPRSLWIMRIPLPSLQ